MEELESIREVVRKVQAETAAPAQSPKGKGNGSIASTTTPENDSFSDLALAERLHKLHGHNIRHKTGLGWLAWDRRRWHESTKPVKRFVYELGADLRAECAKRNEKQPQQWYAAAKRAESRAGIDAIMSLAEALPGIDADDIEFDDHPWLLNCPNGTVDLHTGELREHQREDYLSKLCPIEYHPEAQCPLFLQFLLAVHSGSVELVDYIQVLMGYILSGCTNWQIFCVLYGTGSNGKTTEMEVIKHMLGLDYSHQIDPEELLMHKHAKHTTEIASLRGKRLVIASETSSGRRLNESLIKSMTGGENIRARFMRQDSFEYTPVLKLLLLTNHKPAIRDDSVGMWRRLRLIPFLEQFDGDRRDPEILDKLKAEAQGILAWAVRGAQVAAQGEPTVPKCVRAATEEYKQDEDTIGQFIGECCETRKYGIVSKARLFEAYTQWAGKFSTSKRDFGKQVSAHGFEDGRGTNNVHVWKGISLVDNELNKGNDLK